MTEFEEIDGVLVQVCDHEFSPWYQIDFEDETAARICEKCSIMQYLKPKPEKLPEKKRWWNW